MMDFSNFFQTDISMQEKIYGCGYLIIQTFLLPYILKFGNALMPVHLSSADLNFLFFLLNFCSMLLIFHRYLLEMIKKIPADLLDIAMVTVPMFLVYWLVNMLVARLFATVDPEFANINDRNIGQLAKDNYALMFVGTVFLVPVAEEVFHRGLVFRGLYSRCPALAWIGSVLFFGLIHVMGYLGQVSVLRFFLCLLQYIPAGICLAAAYRLSGNILAPVLIHALSNLLGMLALR